MHIGIPHIKVILKKNVKGRKSFTCEQHLHAFYILNFRRQIPIPRAKNGAQIPHLRVILGDQMALHVLRKITYRTEIYVTWKCHYTSNKAQGVCRPFHPSSNVTPLEFLLINVKKTRKFRSISHHPTHPFLTVPNSPPYKFWATLSNSPVPGHINEATIMLSEGVDLSTWSIHYSTMILCSGGSREGQNGGLVIGILNLSGDRFFRSQSSLT